MGRSERAYATDASYGSGIRCFHERNNQSRKNIGAAVKSIQSLNKSLADIEDKNERIKFILAAYNGGLGHILDAMALAKKYGKNPHVWDKNVSEFILLKSNPEYFNDEVCKFGYFKGRQTVAYVHEVLRYYKIYQEKIPL